MPTCQQRIVVYQRGTEAQYCADVGKRRYKLELNSLGCLEPVKSVCNKIRATETVVCKRSSIVGMDCCNALLAGTANVQIKRLQSIENVTRSFSGRSLSLRPYHCNSTLYGVQRGRESFRKLPSLCGNVGYPWRCFCNLHIYLGLQELCVSTENVQGRPSTVKRAQCAQQSDSGVLHLMGLGRFGVVVNALVFINEVNLRPARLSQYITSHPGQLSLAIPPWVSVMSTSQRAVMPCGWEAKAGMVRVWVGGR